MLEYIVICTAAVVVSALNLGEEFEGKEERLFGEGGFEKIVLKSRNWKN